MLTRQGGIVAAASIALVVLGRLLGIFELFLLGTGGAALVLGAAAAVALARVHLDVARDLRPPRVHAGSTSTVELRIHNRGTRRAPVVQLRDSVEGIARTATVVLGPLAPDQRVAAAYSLPTARRGVLRVGPLEVRISDPFGLAALSTPGAPATDLTVWPQVEHVLPPGRTAGDDVDVAADHPNPLSATGEEFYALRPYIDGDDLRRVHWRASAKRDDLVVRQEERLLQGRATVVLDVRSHAFRAENFERAVSAAASIVLACSRDGFLVRLVTTAGHDSGFGTGGDHVGAILEHLAVVDLSDLGHLATLLASLSRPGGNRGALAVLTGDGDGDPATAAAGLDPSTSAGRTTTIVSFAGGASPGAGHPTIVVVDESTTFASAWNRAMAPPSPVPG